jgi:hypothetical protein
MDEGIALMSISKDAKRCFLEADLAVKRHLFSVVLSNFSFRDRKLSATYRKPFDILLKNPLSAAASTEVSRCENAKSAKWQTFVYDIRTSFWEEADDIAGRLLSLRLAGALPHQHHSKT